MKSLFVVFTFFLVLNFANGQNLIIGTNGFLTNNPFTKDRGFGFYTRMGVEVFKCEIGIKTFFGELTDLEAYGVSLYTFVPIHRYKKWQVVGHVEGGASFIYDNIFGSQNAFQMGLGPGLKYNIRDYMAFEVILEYVIFASVSALNSQNTQLIIPTIGWSVRI